MTISYAITVCNEINEITTLVNFLHPRIQSEDEILIQYDEGGVTDDVRGYLRIINDLHDNINVIGFPLNKDFASYKNNLKNYAKGIFIFQIDADEIPSEILLLNLKNILKSNPVDLLITPRKNIVEGLTEQHVKQWGWRVTDEGWVNWPDAQKRIYKNSPDIQWGGHQVHGMVEGYKTYAALPMEESFSIIHNKEVKRQESQNKRYAEIG